MNICHNLYSANAYLCLRADRHWYDDLFPFYILFLFIQTVFLVVINWLPCVTMDL